MAQFDLSLEDSSGNRLCQTFSVGQTTLSLEILKVARRSWSCGIARRRGGYFGFTNEVHKRRLITAVARQQEPEVTLSTMATVGIRRSKRAAGANDMPLPLREGNTE